MKLSDYEINEFVSFCKEGQLVKAYQELIRLCVDPNVSKKTESSLIYHLARTIDHFEDPSLSIKLYQIAKYHSSSNSLISIASDIRIDKSKGASAESEEGTINRINSFTNTDANSDEEKAVLITLFYDSYSYSSPESITDEGLDLLKKVTDKNINFNLSSILTFRLSLDRDVRASIAREVMRATKASIESTYAIERDYSVAEYKYHTANQEYERANSDLEFLVSQPHSDSLYKNNSSYFAINVMLPYATSKLYLTRAGKGISTVIESFNIYENTYTHLAGSRAKSVQNISGSIVKHAHVFDFANIQIIGTYLYQKTGDPTYLQRAFRVADILGSIGAIYWADIRSRIRAGDTELAAAIAEEYAFVRRQRELDLDRPLQDLLHEQFELYREATAIRHRIAERLDPELIADIEVGTDSVALAGGTAVTFALHARVLYRTVFTPDTVIVNILNPRMDTIRHLTERMNDLIVRSAAVPKLADSLTEVSRKLYRELIAGVEEHLTPDVHVVANRWLSELPFAALRMDTLGEQPRYLGIEHALSQQYSLLGRQLANEAAPRPRHREVLAMAPDFGNDYAVSLATRGAERDVPPLFYNQGEVAKLKELGRGYYLTGARANVENFERYAEDYGILHLATHASADPADGLSSLFYLADGERARAVTADEVRATNLNADLVCLSACETGGGGRHLTEGTVGLTRAFLAAGGRTVVASRWRVDDRATSEMMQAMYGRIRAGEPAFRALRSARRAFWNDNRGTDRAHPFYWAAFDAYGGTEPVRWEDGWSVPWWPLGVVVSLGAVAGAVGFNRRKRRAA